MSQRLPDSWFVRDERVNAVIAWTITGALVLRALSSVLSIRLVAAALAATAAAVALVPAIVSGSWTRTVPWPLLLLASVPLLLGGLAPTFLRLVVTGTGVAALGMLVVVALQQTTSVRMTPGFAVAFVVLATLAFAGLWAVGSAASAAFLGTAFVSTNTELMYVFTAALVGGVVGGGAFRWYFRRQLRRAAGTTERGEVEGA